MKTEKTTDIPNLSSVIYSTDHILDEEVICIIVKQINTNHVKDDQTFIQINHNFRNVALLDNKGLIQILPKQSISVLLSVILWFVVAPAARAMDSSRLQRSMIDPQQLIGRESSMNPAQRLSTMNSNNFAQTQNRFDSDNMRIIVPATPAFRVLNQASQQANQQANQQGNQLSLTNIDQTTELKSKLKDINDAFHWLNLYETMTSSMIPSQLMGKVIKHFNEEFSPLFFNSDQSSAIQEDLDSKKIILSVKKPSQLETLAFDIFLRSSSPDFDNLNNKLAELIFKSFISVFRNSVLTNYYIPSLKSELDSVKKIESNLKSFYLPTIEKLDTQLISLEKSLQMVLTQFNNLQYKDNVDNFTLNTPDSQTIKNLVEILGPIKKTGNILKKFWDDRIKNAPELNTLYAIRMNAREAALTHKNYKHFHNHYLPKFFEQDFQLLQGVLLQLDLTNCDNQLDSVLNSDIYIKNWQDELSFFNFLDQYSNFEQVSCSLKHQILVDFRVMLTNQIIQKVIDAKIEKLDLFIPQGEKEISVIQLKEELYSLKRRCLNFTQSLATPEIAFWYNFEVRKALEKLSYRKMVTSELTNSEEFLNTSDSLIPSPISNAEFFKHPSAMADEETVKKNLSSLCNSSNVKKATASFRLLKFYCIQIGRNAGKKFYKDKILNNIEQGKPTVAYQAVDLYKNSDTAGSFIKNKDILTHINITPEEKSNLIPILGNEIRYGMFIGVVEALIDENFVYSEQLNLELTNNNSDSQSLGDYHDYESQKEVFDECTETLKNDLTKEYDYIKTLYESINDLDQNYTKSINLRLNPKQMNLNSLPQILGIATNKIKTSWKTKLWPS